MGTPTRPPTAKTSTSVRRTCSPPRRRSNFAPAPSRSRPGSVCPCGVRRRHRQRRQRVPVKTLPRPVCTTATRRRPSTCGFRGSGEVDEARDLIARQDRSHVCRTEQPLRDRAGVDSQELIRSGAALDLQNKRGETALMYAARNTNHVNTSRRS